MSMSTLWWLLLAALAVLAGSVGFAVGCHFGFWWGIGAGAVVLFVSICVVGFWLLSNLRITG